MKSDETQGSTSAGSPSIPSVSSSSNFSGVVALDGPSGTGKSTVARQLALRLRTRYLDTGSMYRAATLAVLSTPTDLSDANAVAAVVARAVIDVGTDPHDPSVCLDGVRVDAPIRSAEVTAAVSEVSAVPAVRSRLVAAQRRIIGPGGIVVEGRDTGTVVWPTARPKVFLTANASVRARRRAGQLGDVPLAAVAADLTRRDRFDSTRPLSPLVQADDAIVVDTTDLSIDEVVDRLVDMAMNAHVETDG